MSNKDIKGCKEHGAKKEVMCKKCHEFFCPRCIVDHLQSSHSIDYLAHIDNAVEIIKEQIQKRITKYKDVKAVLSAEKRTLTKKVAILQDNRALDELYKNTVKQIQKEIANAKKSKLSLMNP